LPAAIFLAGFALPPRIPLRSGEHTGGTEGGRRGLYREASPTGHRPAFGLRAGAILKSIAAGRKELTTVE